MTTKDAPTTVSVPPQESIFGQWLSRQARLIGLSRQRAYRAAGWKLRAMDLRGLPWPAIVAGWIVYTLAFVVAAYLLQFDVRATFQAQVSLQAIAGIAAGAGAFARERRSGTFELFWLAGGSIHQLLRTRIVSLLLVLALLPMPGLLMIGDAFPRPLPVVASVLWLASTGLLAMALVIWIEARVPSPAMALLLTVTLAFASAWVVGPFVTAINPFLHPHMEPAPATRQLVLNRLFVVGGALVMFYGAARLLRRRVQSL